VPFPDFPGRLPESRIDVLPRDADESRFRPDRKSGKYIFLYIHYSRALQLRPRKQKSNLKKHAFDLADAPEVIESGETVTFEDRRFAYGEERFVTLGPLDGVLVMIVTVETENHIRIISMRKADRHEQSIYRENLG
jgi:uncharacterized DUF497 family protein